MAKKKNKPLITDWLNAISSMIIAVCTVLTLVLTLK